MPRGSRRRRLRIQRKLGQSALGRRSILITQMGHVIPAGSEPDMKGLKQRATIGLKTPAQR